MIKLSETAFASQVEDLLNIGHWRWMHPRPARVRRGGRDVYETAYSGHKGWLDYLALRTPRILVFELKDETREMTPEQQEWWDMWEGCQRAVMNDPLTVKGNIASLDMTAAMPVIIIPELYLWRPSQIDEIVEMLR